MQKMWDSHCHFGTKLHDRNEPLLHHCKGGDNHTEKVGKRVCDRSSASKVWYPCAGLDYTSERIELEVLSSASAGPGRGKSAVEGLHTFQSTCLPYRWRVLTMEGNKNEGLSWPS